MVSKTVQRIYRFSLSVKDANYEEVKGIVENLIGQGALSRVIRDGIRLVNDLSAGRTDVLLELYPWIADAICPKASDNDDMEKRIADMVASRLEGRLQSTSQNRDIPDTRDYGVPAMKPSKLQKSIAMPLIEPDIDLGDTLVITHAAPQNNGANLLAGMLALD